MASMSTKVIANSPAQAAQGPSGPGMEVAYFTSGWAKALPSTSRSSTGAITAPVNWATGVEDGVPAADPTHPPEGPGHGGLMCPPDRFAQGGSRMAAVTPVMQRPVSARRKSPESMAW
jgi:hypothetical protein